MTCKDFCTGKGVSTTPKCSTREWRQPFSWEILENSRDTALIPPEYQISITYQTTYENGDTGSNSPVQDLKVEEVQALILEL